MSYTPNERGRCTCTSKWLIGMKSIHHQTLHCCMRWFAHTSRVSFSFCASPSVLCIVIFELEVPLALNFLCYFFSWTILRLDCPLCDVATCFASFFLEFLSGDAHDSNLWRKLFPLVAYWSSQVWWQGGSSMIFQGSWNSRVCSKGGVVAMSKRYRRQYIMKVNSLVAAPQIAIWKWNPCGVSWSHDYPCFIELQTMRDWLYSKLHHSACSPPLWWVLTLL